MLNGSKAYIMNNHQAVPITFDNTFTLEEKSDWGKEWAKLDPSVQREIWERLYITPFKTVLRPWWQKLDIIPITVWKHYKLNRKYKDGRLFSIYWAFIWTTLLLFPDLFVRLRGSNHAKAKNAAP